jgi:hypothetical protein
MPGPAAEPRHLPFSKAGANRNRGFKAQKSCAQAHSCVTASLRSTHSLLPAGRTVNLRWGLAAHPAPTRIVQR